MHVDHSRENPYQSPRHDSPAAAGTARGWSYHCPVCDAVCLNFWKTRIQRTDRLPRFPCPSCGTVLQLHWDQKPGNRAVILVVLGLAGVYLLLRAAWAWTPRFVLWFLDRVDIAVVLPTVAAAAIVCVLWVLLRGGFHALSLRKFSAAAQPIAGGNQSAAS